MEEYILLLVSGVLGIGISDTLFFMSLNALGAGLSAIVDCLYSPFIIGLSFLWLGESLNTMQLVGVMIILSAVLSVTQEGKSHPADRRKILLGILWGTLAMASMAVGIVMIKPLLDRSPLLWVTEIRLVGGIAVIILVILAHPLRRRIIGSIFSKQRWGYTLSGSFIGTYLAMTFWLAGMKFTQASTAAALGQTSNIFIFVFAALLLHERITPLRIAAIILGVTGALLVTFG
jgi:drug/metabolite transporter (DMT)-like permease